MKIKRNKRYTPPPNGKQPIRQRLIKRQLNAVLPSDIEETEVAFSPTVAAFNAAYHAFVDRPPATDSAIVELENLLHMGDVVGALHQLPEGEVLRYMPEQITYMFNRFWDLFNEVLKTTTSNNFLNHFTIPDDEGQPEEFFLYTLEPLPTGRVVLIYQADEAFKQIKNDRQHFDFKSLSKVIAYCSYTTAEREGKFIDRPTLDTLYEDAAALLDHLEARAERIYNHLSIMEAARLYAFFLQSSKLHNRTSTESLNPATP